jgi:hypothetical protein
VLFVEPRRDGQTWELGFDEVRRSMDPPSTSCGFDARPPDRGASVAAPLEASDRRFRYFVDAAGGRPKVLYLRHDGDCGLVEPEVTGVT